MYSLRGLSCILIALLLINVLSAKQCFNLEGNTIVDGDPSIQQRQPCDPSAQVSTCCSHGDLCLSNGLCLDNGGDGRFTAQGCTDPGWPAPCRAEFHGCPSSITPDYVPLWMCQSLGHTIDFCCDSADARCCVAALAGNQTLFSLPLWGDVWRPGDGRHSGGSGSAGSGNLGLAEKLTIALSIIFGVLGAVIGLLQLRYMARESKERGVSASLRPLLRRQFQLWFTSQRHGRTTRAIVHNEAAEMGGAPEDGTEQTPLVVEESRERLMAEESQGEENEEAIEME